ncbi:MAG: raffinose/stachyose/melibiose transport system permease protein [Clostridiales bacterium]|nr:raffinose/stachyose/melibiose transport system permease protein [Clostridiales bacterium]
MKTNNHNRISPAFYLMVAPMAVLFFLFHTLPFLKGIFYSFTDWKGYGAWQFVGLRNFLQFFRDPSIAKTYLFTFQFALSATILVNGISLMLACGLNGKIKGRNFLKALYFLPYMLGTLIIGFVFNFIFGNVIPDFGRFFGISGLSENILGTSKAWLGVLFVTVWQSMAFNTMIYLSGLQTVDKEIYEAAAMDGAVGRTRFFKITFPLIAPFFTINMVLSVKNFLMAFDQIMAMTGGGPGTSTTTISLLIYKRGFDGGQFAYQSANAVILFLVVAVISVLQLKILEKREEKMNQ